MQPKVRSIDFEVSMAGSGNLNGDSADISKNEDTRLGLRVYNSNDNLKVSKKRVTLAAIQEAKKNGFNTFGKDVEVKACISANCLRHNLFQEGFGLQNSLQFSDDEIYLISIANAASLIRGWCRSRSDVDSYRKKSPLSVTDAVQTSGDALRREVQTTSGSRSSTSLITSESAGDSVYKFRGSLDLGELGFVSLDPLFDRQALSSDQVEAWRTLVSQEMGIEIPEAGKYRKSTSMLPLCERGVLLPEAAVKALAVNAIQRLLGLEIRKATGFGSVTSVVAKLTHKGEAAMKLSEGVVFHPGSSAEEIAADLGDWSPVVNYEASSDKVSEMSERYAAACRSMKDQQQVEKQEKKEEERKRKADFKAKKGITPTV